MKIGQILLKQKAITAEQLAIALWIQNKWGGILGRILHSRGYVSEETLLEALSVQLEIPAIYLGKKKIPKLILNTIDKVVCESQLVLPFAKDPETDVLEIAVANPRNFHTINILKKELEQPFRLFLAGFIDITNAMWYNFKSRSRTGLMFIEKVNQNQNTLESNSEPNEDIISEIPVGSDSTGLPPDANGYEVIEEEDLTEKYNQLVENLSSNHKPYFHMDLSPAEMAELSLDDYEKKNLENETEELTIGDDDEIEEIAIGDDDEIEELTIGDDDEVEELTIGDDDEVEELLKDNKDLTLEEIDISTTAEIKIIEDNQDNQKPTSKNKQSKEIHDKTETQNTNSKKNSKN
ncbi:MAG: hypothetical protein ACQES9_05795 [Myxococcota bacterium]